MQVCVFKTIIPFIEIETIKNNLQLKLKEDENKIRKSKNVFVIADKNNNLCNITPEKNQELLQKNVTKICKESPQNVETSKNLEAKNIEKSYIDDRVECLAKAEGFITLKCHRRTFFHIQHAVYLIR